ncbi:carboxylesterase family protein [Microbacterium sp. KR10-403]|uniref:carboxylesterase/lipase family protein n=1 Tax=Microbacterium sp. KR10-403 TaxID=3158581 RepID=UPI0032E508C0
MPFITRTVDQGMLRGIDNAGTITFLGVPYGADTSGANRFRPPQPAPRWEGIRDALTFGPTAPQVDTRPAAAENGPRLLSMLYPRTGSPAEGGPIGEDCLRLNIWAPSDASPSPRPVIVWLHGGGFTHGSGNEMAFNGDVLAQAGDLVVVTVTHRLGILGFLDLRELGEEHSANAGMLDIVAALDWVHANIAAFGGDPDRVTVCGQSGGSGKVAMLNAMPAAQGLFHRSIMMSGPFRRPAPEAVAASLRAHAMEIGGHSSVDELRAASLETLLDVQAEILRQAPLEPAGKGELRVDFDSLPGFGPSHDAADIPGDAFGDEASELLAGKGLMIGWTAHEAGMFLADDPSYRVDLTADEASTRLEAMRPIDGIGYADLAGPRPAEPPHLVFARRVSSLMFEKPAREIARLAADRADGVWIYAFEQPTEVLGGLLGACHSLELAYVFGTVDRIPLTGRDLDRLAVSREMMGAWARFAHEGDPGWDRSTADMQNVHCFGTPYGEGLSLPADVDMTAPVV